jgi:cell division septation protein DedD
MPIRMRFRILSAIVLAASLAAGTHSGARAQDWSGGRGSALFRNLRDRLLGRGGPEALREALRLPDAGAAREVMEGLAGRGGDEAVVARAALWVGHYHYGAGEVEAALPWFEKAREAGGGSAERTESDFWIAQCRNLLGRTQPGEPDEGGDGSAAVLGRVARLDGELRVGRVESALRGYLDLEGAARQAGCLGPLLYRIGLAAASGAGDRDLGWATVRAWSPVCTVSPEYALVQAMQPSPLPTGPSESSGDDRDSTATPFVEVPGAPAVEPGPVPVAPEGEGEGSPGKAVTGRGNPAAEAGAARAFSVQLGSFRDAEGAAREARRLQALGLPLRVEVEEIDGETWHRLRLGRYRTREEAEETALARCTGLEWRIVQVEP